MNEKQKFFADEFLIDFNATRAYKAAYGNKKNDNVAAAAAARLLKNVKVRKYIDDTISSIRSEKLADVQEVLEHLTSVLRGKSNSEVVVKGEIMKIPPNEKERLKAVELLGRVYGIFNGSGMKSDNTNVQIVVYGENDLE